MKNLIAAGLAAGLSILSLPASASTLEATWAAISPHNATGILPSLTFRFANDIDDAPHFTPGDLVDFVFDGFAGYGTDSQVASYGSFSAAYLSGTTVLVSPPSVAGVPDLIGTDGSMDEGWRISYYFPATGPGQAAETVLSATRDAYPAPRFSVRAYWSGDPRYCTECSLRLYLSDVKFDPLATSFDAAPASEVPVPASLPLMAAAVGGIAALRRRR